MPKPTRHRASLEANADRLRSVFAKHGRQRAWIRLWPFLGRLAALSR
jgi:hypothetical protein